MLVQNQNQNSILIKDKSGKIKTVNLNMGGIIKSDKPALLADRRQGASDKVKEIINTNTQQSQVQRIDNKNMNGGNAMGSFDTSRNTSGLTQDKLGSEVTNVIAKEMTMPSFYFNREDEEEVAQFKNKDEIIDQKKKEVVLSYVIDEIVKKGNLTLEPGARDRLNRVIESRLREIRDLIETKEALLKSRNIGGVGLDENQAKNILKYIEEYRLQMHNGHDLEAEIINSKKVMEKPVAQFVATPPKQAPEKILPIKDSVLSKILKPQTNLPHISSNQEIVAPQNIKKDDSGSTPTIVKPSFNDWLQKSSVGDGYQPRMVAGPLEELATLDLSYFRQLGSNPMESVAKIKHKIDLLTQDSFARRMEGIKSWRQSPVYRNYLAIGSLSVEETQGVAEVIKQKQLNNQPCLTLEEFEAVADLNQELAY